MVRRVTRTSSQDLKRLVLAPSGGRFYRPIESYDEIVPGVILGDAETALSTFLLKELHVTHLLNAAHGKNTGYYAGYVNTSPAYYEKIGVKFMGIPALDTPSFYLKSYFNDAANFIDAAVRSGGKVLIHCQCGISRSATLVAAYLMLKKGMTAEEAISTIRSRRSIFPNQGFLSQLCDFDYEMKRKGELPPKPFGSEDLSEIQDTLRATQKLPPFRFTTCPARAPSVSRSGYRLSTPFDEYENRQRARSEERFVSDYRSSSPSPSDTYRAVRASSIGPDLYPNRSPIESSDIKTYTRVSPSMRSNYSLISPYSDYNYYFKSRYPMYPYFQPNRVSSDSSRALLRLAEKTKRELTPRDRSLSSSRPYESYTLTSPSYTKTFSTTTPGDSYYNYDPYKYRSYSRYPTASTTATAMPSVLKYPSLMSPSLYSRILRA